MKSENTVLIIAIIVTVVSAISLGLVYYSVSNLGMGSFTGFAVQNVSVNATINITVSNLIVINFTTNNINFGSGTINLSANFSTLDTASGYVYNGTWAVNTTKLVVQNDGTENVTLNLMTWKTNATFIGGSNPIYMYNVTNNEAGSCVNATSFNVGTWNNVNTTYPGTLVCSQFGFLDSQDTIKIDFKLGIPYDATNGSLGDIITATATG